MEQLSFSFSWWLPSWIVGLVCLIFGISSKWRLWIFYRWNVLMCKHYQNPAEHVCESYSGEGLAVCSCWMGCSVPSFGRCWARIVSPNKQFLCQRLHQRFGSNFEVLASLKVKLSLTLAHLKVMQLSSQCYCGCQNPCVGKRTQCWSGLKWFCCPPWWFYRSPWKRAIYSVTAHSLS